MIDTRALFQKNVRRLARHIETLYFEKKGKSLDPESKYYVYALLDPRRPGKWPIKFEEGYTVVLDHEPFYIGKGTKSRKSNHVQDARKGKTTSAKISKINSILEDGLEVIVLQLSLLEKESLAFAKEQRLVDALGRAAAGEGPLTNLARGGFGGASGTWDKKARNSMRERMTGHPVSEETRQKLREANTGKSPSQETRDKIRKANTGRKHTEEMKEKVRAAVQLRHDTHGVSEETRRKIGDAHLGKVMSEESKQKMRKPKSEAAKRNMSEAARNRAPISEETRAKLSLASSTRKRRPWTEEEKQKMRDLKKKAYAEGLKPWNKGKTQQSYVSG